MATKGIDISRYQGSPDFARVKNEVDFVILQVGFGRYSSQRDAQFERSYSECKKYGIPVGAYWYSYAKTAAEALAEAKACMEVIAGKQFEYPIYYDLEEGLRALGRATVSAIATTFCNALEQAGYFAGIYISRSPAQSYLTSEVCSKYALWLAEYGSRLNWSGAAVGIWQYSSAGRVSGINGNVDMDTCYVDYPKLIKEGGMNGYPKQEALKPLDSEIWYKRGDGKSADDEQRRHAIFALKQRMINLGYKLDDTSGFGEGTENAVKDLQRKFNYKQTGEVGENFVKLLMR